MRSDRSVISADAPESADCEGCAGRGRPGYVPVAVEWCGAFLSAWRRCPKRCGARTQEQARLRTQARACSPRLQPWRISEELAPAPADLTPRRQQDQAAGTARETSTKPQARRAATARKRPQYVSEREQVPVLLVDVDDSGRLVADVPGLPDLSDMKSLAGLFGWLGSGLPLGVAKVHRDGKAWDPVVVLSAAAAALVKLPAKMPEGKARERLAARVSKAAADSGMECGALGPGVKVFRRKGADGGAKVSLSLLVVPWLGQGDGRQINAVRLATALAQTPDGPDAVALTRRLRKFVDAIGITPGASEATTGMMLLESVRPREEWDQAARRYRLKAGALPAGDCSVPVAAGSRHPLTRELLHAGERVCEEEDYKQWSRPLTADERLLPWAVAVDVSTSYLSVTGRLGLPLGPLELETPARWDPKRAGLWLCDFSGIETEELLPHPAEWNGQRPSRPGWYATPTVEYMVKEYRFDPSTITRAYVSTHTAALLEEWTSRIRDAYKGSMAALGIVDGMEPGAFLAAYAARKDGADADQERADALVLADAYKAIYKGGVGRWTYRGDSIDDDAEWLEKVAARWWYRPEIRFHIIAAARIAAHRRMRKTLALTGLAPFAVNVDGLMYASSEPSPFPLLPTKPDGSPVPGALRLGAAPGSYKHEASVPMAAVLAALEAEQPLHPARLVHDFTPAGHPVEVQQEEMQHG